ncbi:hypothetical protein CPC08DRAFT_808586 [Agrocybe pediades]|nr:hypothetical protein CPC08DRAFT_808586 [Agrocybe pediades]
MTIDPWSTDFRGQNEASLDGYPHTDNINTAQGSRSWASLVISNKIFQRRSSLRIVMDDVFLVACILSDVEKSSSSKRRMSKVEWKASLFNPSVGASKCNGLSTPINDAINRPTKFTNNKCKQPNPARPLRHVWDHPHHTRDHRQCLGLIHTSGWRNGLKEEERDYQPLEDPMILLGKGVALVDLDLSSLRFWDKLGLGPKSGKKDLGTFVLYDESGPTESRMEGWFRAVRDVDQFLDFSSLIVCSLKATRYGTMSPEAWT